MELGQVVGKEGVEQGAHLVGVLAVPARVLHQLAHPCQRGLVRAVHAGLHGKPLVQHVGLVPVDVLEARQRPVGIIRIALHQGLQRTQPVGEVVGALELRTRLLCRAVGTHQGEQLQGRVGQRALPHFGDGQRIVGTPVLAGHHVLQVGHQRLHQGAQCGQTSGTQQGRIQRLQLFGQPLFFGQHQELLAQPVVQPRIRQGGGQCVAQRFQRRLGIALADGLQQGALGQLLAGFPAIEQVVVVAQQEGQVLVTVGVIHHHRRGEVPQQRQHRSPGIAAFHALEDEVLLRGCQLQQTALLHLAAVAGKQCHVHRDVQRTLASRHRMGLGVRQQLCQRQHQPLVCGIVLASHLQPRRAGGGVPAQELPQVAPVGIGHGGHEGLAGHGLAVMALEIQIHAAPEAVHAQQRLQHADDFRTFLVDGGGVEVVDGLIAVRADGVAHRAGIFGELHLTQHPHVAHALNGPHAAGGLGIHAGGHLVGGEFLVAEHRQPFLQRQLEPVAAGDAVAGPVVEVLMPDDRFDPLEVGVGGHEGVGEHVLGVEDVQTLVLHRPHVEVRGGHDHEAIQVQFQPEAAFVPGNGLLQTAQREVGTVDLLGLCPDLQQHLASRGQPVAGLVHGQIASH